MECTQKVECIVFASSFTYTLMLTIGEWERRFIDFTSLTTALHYSNAMELRYAELLLFSCPLSFPSLGLFTFFSRSHLKPAYYLLILPFSPVYRSFFLPPLSNIPRLLSDYRYPIFLPSVPAMITSHPNTTMAKKGHLKELNCTARGEWPIIIRWERGDTVIDPDRNPRYSITTSPNEKTDEVLSTLKVKKQIACDDTIIQPCVWDPLFIDKWFSALFSVIHFSPHLAFIEQI